MNQRSPSILLLLFLSISPAWAEIIPASRRITWQDAVGVTGGIPTRTTIHATLTPTGGSDSAQIQAALDACPADQVVKLSVGTFIVDAQVSIRNRTVLRGAGTGLYGAQQTIISAPNGTPFQIYEFQAHADPVSFAAATGAAKGATTIQLASAPADLGIGMCVQIQEDNDPAIIVDGIEGGGGSWAKGQWVRITGIAGTTYTIDQPLYSAYSASLNPRIRYPFLNAGGTSRNLIEYAGIEDLKIINTASGSSHNIQLGFAANCWVKNVWSNDAGVSHIWAFDTYRCTVQHSYIADVLPPITSSRGYGIQLGTTNSGLPSSKTTAMLIEDNIFDGCRGTMLIGYGASGVVSGYNYHVNTLNEVASIQKPDINIHSSFPIMFLVEGNIGVKLFAADMFHGNGWWGTLLRNWSKGAEAGKNSALTSVELDYQHHNYNAVGNIYGYNGIVAYVSGLGSPGDSIREQVVLSQTISYNNQYRALMLGYEGEGGSTTNGDPAVATTLIDHGSYDYVSGAIHWDPSIADHVIPSSYYVAAKPSWFGSISWPPINPESPGTATNTSIPAGWRFVNNNEDYLTGSVSAPEFSPVAGLYTSPQSVTITSSTSGATIRYTTNGSTPTSSSGTVYSTPVSLSATTTLKAIAYNGVLADSSVTTGTYTISSGSPGDGTVIGTTTVTTTLTLP